MKKDKKMLISKYMMKNQGKINCINKSNTIRKKIKNKREKRLENQQQNNENEIQQVNRKINSNNLDSVD